MEHNKNRFSVLPDDNGDEEQDEVTPIPRPPIQPVRYILEKTITPHLYQGVVKSGQFSHPVAFIAAKNRHTKNFHLLKSVGCGNEFTVDVEQIIIHDKLGSLFVTELVVPISHLFEKELKSFRSLETDAQTKAAWWKLVEPSFTPLLTDVVHGLIYLDSHGYCCGDLYQNMFVDTKGRGKILPSFVPQTKTRDSEKQDIHNLVKKMKNLICLPFKGVIDESYGLPFGLTKFFSFATVDKLVYLPLYAIYNHSFFWSIQENISFILDLSFYTKEYSFLLDAIENSITWSGLTGKWDSAITHSLFRDVFDKPLEDARKQKMLLEYLDTVSEPVEKPKTVVAAYNTQKRVDMIRYVRACFNHINERAEKERRYSQVSIEAKIRGFFPTIYIDFYEGLCNATWLIHRDTAKRDSVMKVFEKWSSPYFVKQTNAIKDKVKGILEAMSSD